MDSILELITATKAAMLQNLPSLGLIVKQLMKHVG